MADLQTNVQNFINQYATESYDKGIFSVKKQEEDTSPYLDEDASKGRNNPFPSGAFEIGKDINGSIKYSFDTIYDDKKLIQTAKDYFESRDGVRYNDRDVVDEFVNDRTWKQANTLSMMNELRYVLDEETDIKQKERLAYLTDYWHKLPNFYAEGGRGWWAGLSSNISKGFVDPANYVGPIFAGQFVKQSVKQAGKELLKRSTQKQLTKNYAIKATGITAAADAVIFGGADAIMQSTEREIGMRDEYDISRIGYSTILGVGTTIIPTGVGSYFGARTALNKRAKDISLKTKKPIIEDLEIKNKTNVKSVDDIINKRVGDTNIKKDPLSKIEEGTAIANRYERIKGYIFDKYNPMRILQEKLTGVQGSVEGLKRAYKNLKAKGYDPVTNPYFMFRMLVGSNTRADDFAKHGVKLMSDINAKEFKYTATGNKGFLGIIKDFNDAGHMEHLLGYMAALRSNQIRNNAAKLPVGRRRTSYLKNAMFTQAEADRLIHYAELSPDQFFRRYKKMDGLTEKPTKPDLDFVTGAKDLKKYFDDLLLYQKQAGIIDEKQLKSIQKAHPFYIPFYSNGKIGDAIDMHSQALSTAYIQETLRGIGSPAKKAMKGRTAKTGDNYKPLFEGSLDYTYSAVLAADKNVAKRSFYRMIDEGIKNGVINEGQVVREIKGPKLRKVNGVITKSAIDKLEDMGIKVDKTDLEGADISFPTMAFADSIIDKADAIGMGANKKIDIFYDNGKFRAFIIEDPALMEMYQSWGNKTNNILNKINKFTQPFARIPAQMITHSPPFMAYNMIRDTLSGTVNSAFGFIPGYTTLKGGLRTNQGIGKSANVKESINMVRRSDVYRKALVSGMGYSSRRDTERYLTFKDFDKYGNSQATGFYKKTLNFIHQNYAGTKVKGAAKKSIGFWTEFVSRAEYATRLGEFEMAKKAGFGDVGAAFAAREVATDFGMGGSSKLLNMYARNTMFFNAGLQGFYRGMRRAKENPIKFGGMIGATVVAPELMLWALNNERREYEEVPDEVKQLNYLIPWFMDEQPDGSHKWPNGQRRVERFIPIPKPYDFGVFANMATGILESIQESSPGIGATYAWKSLNQIMPGSGFYRGSKPGDFSGSTVLGITVPFIEEPGIFRPWADIAANKDWVGAQITPYGLSDIPPELRVKSNTRESIIQFAEFLKHFTTPEGRTKSVLEHTPLTMATGAATGAGIGAMVGGVPGAAVGTVAGAVTGVLSRKLINPIEMDYIINSYFTGLLSYPLDLLDAAVWDEEEYGEKPTQRSDEKDLRRAPWSIVTKRFNVNTPVKASQNIRKLYEIQKYAEEVVGADFKKGQSFRYLLNALEMEESFTNQEANELRAISYLLSDVMLKLSESRKLRNNIQFLPNNPNLTDKQNADEKRLQIEELRETENEIAYQALLLLKDADFDKAMTTIGGWKKYSLPKEEEYSDPLKLRKLFGVE